MFGDIRTFADVRIRLALALLLLAPSIASAAAEANIVVAQATTSSPVTQGQAIASSPTGAAGVLVHGMASMDIAKLMPDAAAVRSLQDVDNGKAVIIGHGLAQQLSLGVGSTITLVTPHGIADVVAPPLMKTYTVAAVLARVPYNDPIVVMAIAEARSYANP